MNPRRVLSVTLALLLAGMTAASGVRKIGAFHHRHAGERALVRADLSLAYERFLSALRWQPGDPVTHVLVGRVVQHALANGLPVEMLEGRDTLEQLAVGLGAIARGVALNPVDAWGWFQLANLYEGHLTFRVRRERMLAAGRSVLAGPGSPPAAAAVSGGGLEPEDVVAIAAALKARDLEPNYYIHHDFLANLYWDRGLREEAARQIRTSFSLTTRLQAHDVLSNDGLTMELADDILAGIDAASANRFIGPVMTSRARAELHARLGRLDEAIAAYQDLRETGDAALKAECDLALGRLEQKRERYRESIPLLRRAIEEEGGDVHGILALYYLGLAHAKLGEHEAAVPWLRRYVELLPDSIIGYLALAESVEALGRAEEADRIYIATVRRFPRSPGAYRRAIESLRRHGRAGEALLYAQGLRKVDPDDDSVESLIRDLEREAGR